MSKREVAIASVMGQLDGRVPFDALYQLSTEVVDRLIRDGVLALGYAGNHDIGLVVEMFQVGFGTTAPNRTDRYAASRLVKRYGVDEVSRMVDQLATRKTEKFAPVVNNLVQFEQKLPQIMRFLQNRGGDEVDV